MIYIVIIVCNLSTGQCAITEKEVATMELCEIATGLVERQQQEGNLEVSYEIECEKRT